MAVQNKQLEAAARKLPATATPPSTLSGEGAWYVKIVSGVAEGFYRDDQGNEVQITNNGAVAGAGGGGGAVDSVNGATGVIVLDADDISDAATTNKFTSAADISKLSGIAAGAEVNYAAVSQVDAEAGTSTTLFSWSPQRVAQAIAALAPGGGGGAVDSVNGATGVVVLDSDDVAEGITNLYQAAKASAGEITAGTETAVRAHSPADIVSYIDQHAASGSTAQVFRLTLPDAANLAARLVLATAPAGWTLTSADLDAETQFGSDTESLVIIWDAALGTKLADISVYDNNTSTSAVGGIKVTATSEANPSNVKVNSSLTKAVVQFTALGGLPAGRDVLIQISLA